jgi:hypothetical protein
MPRATCSPGVRPRSMATSDRLTDGDTEGKAVDEGLFDALVVDVLGDGKCWSRRATPSSGHCDPSHDSQPASSRFHIIATNGPRRSSAATAHNNVSVPEPISDHWPPAVELSN